ncbi:glycine betaine ABC transporter substrate-binding protein [Nocardiopsis coralliicola]
MEDSKQVTIAVNPWSGYEANVAVLSYLLENELGVTVQLEELDVEPTWQGLAAGNVDVNLENWGRDDLMEIYGDPDSPAVVDGGETGLYGIHGWFVPSYVAEQHPEVMDLDGLKANTDVFDTSETSGGTGRFISSDPLFQSQDQGMINHFELDLEIDYAGSEEAQIDEVRAAYEQEQPALFYFYEPQWVFEDLDLTQVELPDYVDMCDLDPDDIGCGYPSYELTKVYSTDFAEENGVAYQFLDRWQWSNDDQNEVAKMIADEGLSYDEAAEKWLEANEDVWQEWLPAQQ